MPDYPRLPDPPHPDPDDTAVLYGCRLLQFLLQTGVYCTCDAEQLRLAEHASQYAVTARGILPAAVDRLSTVRHEIHAQIGRLAIVSDAPGSLPASPDATIGAPGNDGPGNPGGRVPRQPYPLSHPPAGDRLAVPIVLNF